MYHICLPVEVYLLVISAPSIWFNSCLPVDWFNSCLSVDWFNSCLPVDWSNSCLPIDRSSSCSYLYTMRMVPHTVLYLLPFPS